MNIYNYPVFFEIHNLDAVQKLYIENYFRIRRKSGGGDCSLINKVGEDIYQIAFTHHADQKRVLRRTSHVLELPWGTISLNVRGSLDASTTTLSPVRKQLTSPPGGPEHELHLDSYLLRYLKESPRARRDLQQKLSFLGCSVQLLSEEGRAVVRGSGQTGSCRAGVEDDLELGRWMVEVEKLFEQLVDRYKCHYEVDPSNVHTLLQSSTLGSEDVRVYSEGGEGFAVVVGVCSEVQAKLKEIEAKTVQRLSPKRQAMISTICRLGQAKLRLLGAVIEKELDEFVPGVKVTRSDSSQLVLEGSVNEVRTARQMVTDKTSLVLERVVSGESSNLLTFLREEYVRPGALGSLLGLGSQVQVELGDTELRLFTLSLEKMDQAEKALLREFGEEMIDVFNCDSFPPELKSTIEKKVMEMNQHRCRVVARYVPGCQVQLLGHVKEVHELREEIQSFLIDRARGRTVGSPQQNQIINSRWEEEVVSDASYSLHWGLQVVVRQGDITKEEADALVNAANGDLDHAGGVAAALSRAGGPEVQQASSDLVKQVGRLATGRVVETTGGKLPCKILLHAVGPVGGIVGGNERPLLEKTVKSALHLAETLELQTLAMPCISSGIFGVPLKVCIEAIVSAVRDFGRAPHTLSKVTLIDVRAEVVRAMQEACDRLLLGRRESSEGEERSRTTTATTNASHGDTANANTRGAASSDACVQVEIVQGSIEEQQVDVLVSPMLGNEPLSSRVGKVLFEAAGQDLLKPFQRGSQDQITPGNTVLVEGLSVLGSSRVFFLSCTRWKYNPKGPAVQALKQGVRNILTSCDDKGFRSVAFPVVGKGIVLNFPHEVATRALLEEIHRYQKRRANGSLSLVRIVVHPTDKMSTKALQTAQNALPLSRLKIVNCQTQDIRIVLLGKTGGGKSSSGNTIFGEESVFLAASSSTSTTEKCEAQTKSINGRNLTLIDTPGLFDTNSSEEELKPKIVSCITECAPGPHAFVIVLKVERYTVHEKETISKIEKYFSPEAFKYATVLFTHGEDLNGLPIEEFVQQNEELKTLVDKCEGRCHVIDNRHWNNTQQGQYRNNQYQVTQLLNTIEKMVRENGGVCYTNEMLQAVETGIQEEIEKLRKETIGQMSDEEMRKQAKRNMYERLLIQLTGIAVGAIVGAFLGMALVIRFTSSAAPLIVRLAIGSATAPAVCGVAAGIVLGAAATAGAIRGGMVGAAAVEESETVQDAAWTAANAVLKEAKDLYKKGENFPKRFW